MKTADLMRQGVLFSHSLKCVMASVPLLILMAVSPLAAPQTRADSTPAAAPPASQLAEPETATPKPEPSADKPVVSPDKESNAKTVEPAATPEVELGEKWGINVLSTRLTAAGCMIDFRYRVLDPEKAAKLSDPHTHPYIIDEATGAKFIVPSPPKVGQLRNTRKPVADKNYFILFANPSNCIKGGGKVSVVIGDLKIAHLTVE